MEHAIIEYNGTQINAVVDDDGTRWIAVRPICEGMGMDWLGQYTKLKKDPRYNCWESPMVAQDGKNRKMLCLPKSQIHAWLNGINVNYIKRQDVRDKALRYPDGMVCFS